MPVRVHLEHDYDHPAQAVWNIAVDQTAYVKVMQRCITFFARFIHRSRHSVRLHLLTDKTMETA